MVFLSGFHYILLIYISLTAPNTIKLNLALFLIYHEVLFGMVELNRGKLRPNFVSIPFNIGIAAL